MLHSTREQLSVAVDTDSSETSESVGALGIALVLALSDDTRLSIVAFIVVSAQGKVGDSDEVAMATLSIDTVGTATAWFELVRSSQGDEGEEEKDLKTLGLRGRGREVLTERSFMLDEE